MRSRIQLGASLLLVACGMDVRNDAAGDGSGITVADPSLGEDGSGDSGAASNDGSDEGDPSGGEGPKLESPQTLGRAVRRGRLRPATRAHDPRSHAVRCGTDDLLQAIGLNCPGESPVIGAP